MPVIQTIHTTMADFVAKFYDSEQRPPRGGWSVSISGMAFSGFSESQVREAVKSWRVNNGTFVSDHEIMREIWEIWRKNEPERETRDFPGIGTSIANFTRAMGRVAKAIVSGNSVVQAQTEKERRESICNSCTFLDLSDGEPRCGHCTCPLKYKLALTTERCPIGKF